jgi:hypothetical protein
VRAPFVEAVSVAGRGQAGRKRPSAVGAPTGALVQAGSKRLGLACDGGFLFLRPVATVDLSELAYEVRGTAPSAVLADGRWECEGGPPPAQCGWRGVEGLVCLGCVEGRTRLGSCPVVS